MARFLLTLILLAAVVVVLGFYLDWFDLGVREEKIQKDLQTAEEKARELGKQFQEEAREMSREAKDLAHRAQEEAEILAETKTAKGEVTQVQPANNRFTVRTKEGEELVLFTDKSSQFEADDQPVRLEDVRAGDIVTVAYRVVEGEKIAVSVTIQRS